MFGHRSEPAARQAADDWFTPGRFAALLAALICASYPEVLIGQATFFHRDFAVFGYPLAYYHRESFWQGAFPLWTPLNYCGLPFLAQWNTLCLYPLSLLYLLFPLSWSLGVFCLLHLFLAGMGIYFLAYRWTENRFAAAVAGLVYPFNALLLNCLMWPNNIAALGWLPWVVLAAERGWREGGRFILLAALAGAMQMLSGAPEVIWLTWVLLAALLAGELASTPGKRWRMSARFVVLGLWVAGLAAAQLIPFLDLLAHSQRGEAFADSSWSMPAWGWANLLVPLYRSLPAPHGPYAQPGQFWIPSYYLGVGVFALALLAVGLVRRRRVWLLGALTALCLLLALGEHGLVYSALKSVLPGLGFMRYPIKFVILPAVLVPLLAAIFVARCLAVPQSDWRRRRSFVFALGAVLVAAIAALVWFAYQHPLRGTSAQVAAQSGASRVVFLIAILTGVVALCEIRRPSWQKLVRFGLLLLFWLDAMTVGPRPNPTTPRWVYEPNLARQELHLAPPPRMGESRVMLQAEAESNLHIITMTNAADHVLYSRLALFANANLLDEIPKVVGMYSLYLKETEDVLFTLLGTPQPPPGLADLLAISHLNAPGKVTKWEFRPTYLRWVTAGQQPRFADAADTLSALAAPEFDPRQTVFLPPEARGQVTVSNASPAKVSVRQFSAHKVQLEVEASEPAMVVIAQSFFHNWRARVDGQPARLWRANHAFQALEVPAGASRVTLTYEDRTFYCGGLISLLSVGVWVALWLRTRKQPIVRA